MKLPRNNLDSCLRAIEQEDLRNVKKDSDIYLSSGKILLKSPDGNWHYLTVADDGTIGSSPL